MSLVGELRDPRSPVSAFMREAFPNVRIFNATARENLSGNTPLQPPAEAQAWAPYHGTLGTAIDYRLRCTLQAYDVADTVAFLGAEYALDAGAITATLVQAFFTYAQDLMVCLKPVGRRLPAAKEADLNKICWILALFDQVVRAGVERCVNSPLFRLPRQASLVTLLDVTPPFALPDMKALSYRFIKTQPNWLGRPVHLNPTFAGSSDIGGADADFIVDGCLIDIKTSIAPLDSPSALYYQLLGYALLDFDDALGISSVGLYAARFGVAMCWPIPHLMVELAGRKPPTLKKLRRQFKSLLADC